MQAAHCSSIKTHLFNNIEEVSPKRPTIPGRERLWRQKPTFCYLERLSLAKHLLSNSYDIVSGEPGARPRARVHAGEKL